MGTQTDSNSEMLEDVEEEEVNNRRFALVRALENENFLKRKFDEDSGNASSSVKVRTDNLLISPNSSKEILISNEFCELGSPCSSVQTNELEATPNINKNYVPLSDKCKNNIYISSDKGPYIVYIENKDRKPIHAMTIGKYLRDIYFNIYKNIINIEKINFYRIKIGLKNFECANTIISLPFWETKNLIAFIPNHSISIQGVVRDIDTTLSEEEIMTYAEAEQEILKVRRITKKDKNNTNMRVNTPVVFVTFRGQKLPSEIKLLGVLCRVDQFKEKIRQCTNCFSYGHFSSNCVTQKRCPRCSQRHEYLGQDCIVPPHCIHCNVDGHSSLDSAVCPEFARQNKIKEVMVEKNIPFLEAIKFVKRNNVSDTYASKLNVAAPAYKFKAFSSVPPHPYARPINRELNTPIVHNKKVVMPRHVQKLSEAQVESTSANFPLQQNISNQLNIPQTPILNSPYFNNARAPPEEGSISGDKENLKQFIFSIIRKVLYTDQINNKESLYQNIQQLISNAIESCPSNLSIS